MLTEKQKSRRLGWSEAQSQLQRPKAGIASEPTDLKEYLGIVWIDDKPGLRFTLLAKDANEAGALAEAKYGKHPMSVWNEEDAHRIR